MQIVNGGVDLGYKPLDVGRIGRAGCVDDFGPGVDIGPQPSDGVVEVVDTTEMIFGSGGEHQPLGFAACAASATASMAASRSRSRPSLAL
jgi:hypothetical protein